MRRFIAVFLIVFVLALAGCRCTAHREYLEQVRENLVDDIRPKYKTALEASGRDPALVANDLALVDDTVASIDIALSKINNGEGE